MMSEQDDETQKEEKLQELLESRFLTSLQHLNAVLFDEEQNKQYFNLNKKKIAMASNDHCPISKQSYEQIFALYGNRSQQIPILRRAVRLKYQTLDIYPSHKTRKGMWLLLSKASHRIQQNSGYYDSIKDSEYPEYYGKVIEGDVKRTLENKSPQTHKKLSNILRSLARRNPYVGYCQGMNFIINFLLTSHFTEEQAFWVAVQLFEDILPKNYYTNMLGVAIDLKMVDIYLKMQRPQVSDKLEELSVSISIFALQWLVCLGTTILPFNVLTLLWDLLFSEGSVVLLKMVILLIDELAPMILNCVDMNQFLTQLQPLKKKLVFDEHTFLERLKNIFIDRSLINFGRRVYESLMRINNNDSLRKKNQVKCDPKWPICHHQLQKNKVQQADPQPWVFKQDGPPRIIDDYLDLKSKKQKVHREDSRQHHRKLMIGRMAHTCEPSAQSAINNNIELSEYDPETNSYHQSSDSIGHEFIESATFLKETIVFHVPHKQ